MNRLHFTLLALLVAAMPVSAFARAKTDIIVLTNGDRLTCEIKEMQRGVLSAGTDAMNTVVIEWDDIDSLSSPYFFRVENEVGDKYFGRISLARGGPFRIESIDAVVSMEKLSVVEIMPLEKGFFQQLDGSISLGFSLTKADELAQLSLDIEVTRRTRLRELELDINSITTWQQDEDATVREDASLSYKRLFAHKFYAIGSAGAQSNDELGLDMRVLLAAGLGANWIHTNRQALSTAAGLSVNREWSRDLDGQTNLEAFLGAEYEIFRYDFPKTDISIETILYPSLNDWGRVRTESDLGLRREVVKDFIVDISVYLSTDNRPASTGAEHIDYGLVMSLGWTF